MSRIAEAADFIRAETEMIQLGVAYMAPEQISAKDRQYFSINTSILRVFEIAEASTKDSELFRAVELLAEAFMADYSEPVNLSDLKTRVMERIREDGSFEAQVEDAVFREELGLNNEEDG